MSNLMNKTIAKVWTFASSSSSKTYETLQYTDGTTSCNCPGWTRRAQRTCKHTRAVDMDLADNQCVASQDYTSGVSVPTPVKTEPAPAPKKTEKKKPVSSSFQKPKVRKISWK